MNSSITHTGARIYKTLREYVNICSHSVPAVFYLVAKLKIQAVVQYRAHQNPLLIHIFLVSAHTESLGKSHTEDCFHFHVRRFSLPFDSSTCFSTMILLL